MVRSDYRQRPILRHIGETMLQSEGSALICYRRRDKPERCGNGVRHVSRVPRTEQIRCGCHEVVTLSFQRPMSPQNLGKRDEIALGSGLSLANFGLKWSRLGRFGSTHIWTNSAKVVQDLANIGPNSVLIPTKLGMLVEVGRCQTTVRASLAHEIDQSRRHFGQSCPGVETPTLSAELGLRILERMSTCILRIRVGGSFRKDHWAAQRTVIARCPDPPAHATLAPHRAPDRGAGHPLPILLKMSTFSRFSWAMPEGNRKGRPQESAACLRTPPTRIETIAWLGRGHTDTARERASPRATPWHLLHRGSLARVP